MATIVDFGRTMRDRFWTREEKTEATATGATAIAELPEIHVDDVNYSLEITDFTNAGMAAMQMAQPGQAAQTQNASGGATYTITTANAGSNLTVGTLVSVSGMGGFLGGASMSPYFTYSMPQEMIYRAGGNGLASQSAGRQADKKMKKVDAPNRDILRRLEPASVREFDTTDPRKRLAAEAEDVLGYTPLRKALRTPGALRRVLAKLEIAVLDEESVNRYKAQMVEHYETHGKMQMPTWRLKRIQEYTQPVPEFVLSKAVQIKRELPEAQFYIDQLAVDPFLIVSLVELMDWNHNRQRQLDPETAAYVEVWAEPKFEAAL
jgi:hypothetical protein